MPNDFCSKSAKLNLENGSSLGEELMIEFNEEDLKIEKEVYMESIKSAE